MPASRISVAVVVFKPHWTPRMLMVHCAAPLAELSPSLHSLHAMSPKAGWCLPASHAAQALPPEMG
eukprot:2826339-Prymnesium_polylepis.1